MMLLLTLTRPLTRILLRCAAHSLGMKVQDARGVLDILLACLGHYKNRRADKRRAALGNTRKDTAA